MKFLKSCLLIPAGLALASCHTTRKAATSAVELNSLNVSANNNPLQIFRGAATRVWDITHTSVALSFNFKDKTAKGKASIALRPYAKDTDLIVLDAKGMKIDTVAAVWNEVPEDAASSLKDRNLINTPHHHILHYAYDGKELRITLPAGLRDEIYGKTKTIFPKGAFVLYISYTAMPYADSSVGGSSAISEDRGLYFINTDGSNRSKPVEIWTQGETESNSHWLPTIDKPNERFTVQVSLTVPDTMQTLSNGYLAASKKAGSGLRNDTWIMDKPIQPYAIMFAIGRFAIAKDDHPGGVPVEYYVEPRYADAAKDIFHKTPQMIDYFSHVTGVPYPWNKYSQIVVRDYVSGAMENTSASLFGEFMNGTRRELKDKPGNEDVVSHELFHQWFGDYVTAESWSNLTLNESFATYGEVLWRRHSQGLNSADELAAEDMSRYIQSAESKDPPLVRYYYRDREDMFDRVSYQKGGAILRYINALAGDEYFSKAMKLYLTKNALHPAEASDWRKALEEATGADWTQFFNEWYYRGGYPLLKVRYDYDDAAKRLIVTTSQRSSTDSSALYHLSLKAGILDGGGLSIIDWKINRKIATDTIRYTGSTRPVFMPDFYRSMPGTIEELNKTQEQYLRQLLQTGGYMSKRRALTGALINDKRAYSPEMLELSRAALSDSVPGIRYLMLSLIGGVPEGWKDALKSQVKYLATQDAQNRIRAESFVVLGQWKKVDGAAALAKTAVNDESYQVAGAALRALTRMQPDTAYDAAKALMEKGTAGDAEEAALDAIAQKGKPGDYALFANRAVAGSGAKQMGLANNILTYALHTKDDKTFSQSVQLLSDMARAENIKGYRTTIGSMVFAAGQSYSNAKTKEDKKTAATRLPVIASFEDSIIANEKDASAKEQYRILKSRSGQ